MLGSARGARGDSFGSISRPNLNTKIAIKPLQIRKLTFTNPAKTEHFA